jgi:hypothetical protein
MRSPEGCLSGRTIRGAAAFTLVGEFIEVGDIVQHSTPDFAETGSTPSASFLREETSAHAQVSGRFRFDEQPPDRKTRYVGPGLASWNGDVLLHRVLSTSGAVALRSCTLVNPYKF